MEKSKSALERLKLEWNIWAQGFVLFFLFYIVSSIIAPSRGDRANPEPLDSSPIYEGIGKELKELGERRTIGGFLTSARFRCKLPPRTTGRALSTAWQLGSMIVCQRGSVRRSDAPFGNHTRYRVQSWPGTLYRTASLSLYSTSRPHKNCLSGVTVPYTSSPGGRVKEP